MKIKESDEKFKVQESLEAYILKNNEANDWYKSVEEIIKSVESKVEIFESNLMSMKSFQHQLFWHPRVR